MAPQCAGAFRFPSRSRLGRRADLAQGGRIQAAASPPPRPLPSSERARGSAGFALAAEAPRRLHALGIEAFRPEEEEKGQKWAGGSAASRIMEGLWPYAKRGLSQVQRQRGLKGLKAP